MPKGPAQTAGPLHFWSESLYSSHVVRPAISGLIAQGNLLMDSLTRMAQYPSGKGEVCKTFTSAFDSHLRLKDKPRTLLRMGLIFIGTAVNRIWSDKT